MKIIIDSREKLHAITGIIAYFDAHGIDWEIRALPTGDYMAEGCGSRVIDRKRTLNELAHNLCSPDRRRFYAEVRRARATGIRLIILCEHSSEVKDLAGVREWKPKWGRVSGKSLADAIYSLTISYGVPEVFCGKRSTGKRIVELLTEEDGNETDRI